MYCLFIKRILDLFFSFISVLVLSPILILVLIVILILDRNNPIFVQTRPGKNARLFKVYKFKTMNNKKDKNGNLLPDAERLTPIGKIIRKTSIDEIPQLINVLKGDMSLIGPRPLLVDYLPLYSKEQARRHEVRPGITGWAQINGRNAISWENKFNYDVYYVDHCSFLLDLRIFFRTIEKVFNREGVNQEGQATAKRFVGK